MCDLPEQSSTSIVSITIVALFSLLLSSCQSQEPSNRPEVTTTEAAPLTETDSTGSYVDAYGREIELSDAMGPIVSLAPNLTEIVAFLGQEDRLVGRTDYCNFPPAVASSVPSIGTLGSYNYEEIVALDAAAILMMTFDGSSRKEYDRLVALGRNPIAFAEGDLDAVTNLVDSVGIILGVGSIARHKTARMRRTLDSLRRARGPEVTKTLVIIAESPLITTSGGFVADVIESAGGSNVAAEEPLPYPRIGRERVLAWNPEVIVVPVVGVAATAMPHDSIAHALLERYPEWHETEAGRTGRIVGIDADLLARPGPRFLDGIRALRPLLLSDGVVSR